MIQERASSPRGPTASASVKFPWNAWPSGSAALLFFAYDRAMLTGTHRPAARRPPGRTRRRYAVKANPMPAVVQHLSGLVDSFDVASVAEMRTALDTPTPATKVSFAGPGKTVDELAQAVAAGVTIEMESEDRGGTHRGDR